MWWVDDVGVAVAGRDHCRQLPIADPALPALPVGLRGGVSGHHLITTSVRPMDRRAVVAAHDDGHGGCSPMWSTSTVSASARRVQSLELASQRSTRTTWGIEQRSADELDDRRRDLLGKSVKLPVGRFCNSERPTYPLAEASLIAPGTWRAARRRPETEPRHVVACRERRVGAPAGPSRRAAPASPPAKPPLGLILVNHERHVTAGATRRRAFGSPGFHRSGASSRRGASQRRSSTSFRCERRVAVGACGVGVSCASARGAVSDMTPGSAYEAGGSHGVSPISPIPALLRLVSALSARVGTALG